MIADALKILFEVGAKAAGAAGKAQILEVGPQDKAIVDSQGVITHLRRPVPDRNHSVERLADIAALVTNRVGVHFVDETHAGAVWIESLWAQRQIRVHLVCDDRPSSTRADKAVCVLEATEELDDIAQAPAMTQGEFAKWLRIRLAGCAVPQRLIDWVAKITWSNKSAATGSVGNGRESLGLDIESNAMSDAGEAPDIVTLRVQLFATPVLCGRHEINFAFIPDAKARTLQIVPLAGQLDRAWRASSEMAEEELKRLLPPGFPIYWGRP